METILMEDEKRIDDANPRPDDASPQPKADDFKPRFTINPERRKFAYLAGIVIGLLIVGLWYCVWVGHIIGTTNISSTSCNETNANVVKDSGIAYEYGMNPLHWSNLTNWLGTTCSNYQAYVTVYNQEHYQSSITGTSTTTNGSS